MKVLFLIVLFPAICFADLFVSWAPSNDARTEGYLLEIRTADQLFYELIDTKLNTQATLADLPVGKKLYLRARAYGAGLFSAYTKNAEIVLQSEESDVGHQHLWAHNNETVTESKEEKPADSNLVTTILTPEKTCQSFVDKSYPIIEIKNFTPQTVFTYTERAGLVDDELGELTLGQDEVVRLPLIGLINPDEVYCAEHMSKVELRSVSLNEHLYGN